MQGEFSHNRENWRRMDSSEILRKKITFLLHKRTQNYVTGHSYRFCRGKIKKKKLQVTKSPFL